MPEMKDLVPSIGSSTQTYSASARSLPNSSPMMPWSGKVPADERAHRGLGGVVGRGHRVEAAGAALVLDAERGAEKRQDGLAGDGRKLVHEGREIDRRHAARPSLIAHPSTYRRPAWRATACRLVGLRGAVRRRSRRPVLGRSKGRVHEHPKRSQPAGAGAAVALVATLISIYIVSQFLRNSVGVIAPDLAPELGLSAAEIGLLVERFLFRLRGGANSARGGARPVRPALLPPGLRRRSPWSAPSCSPRRHRRAC